MEHWVAAEREGRGGVLTLELSGRPRNNVSTIVELNHRLKSDYRHFRGDQRIDDPRQGVIAFDRATNGADESKWVISSYRRRTPWEVRRELTDACRRHLWAIRVVQESNNINAFADQIHCGCPADPPCEVCLMAAKFSINRRLPTSDGTRYWTDLQHAVARDLGWTA